LVKVFGTSGSPLSVPWPILSKAINRGKFPWTKRAKVKTKRSKSHIRDLPLPWLLQEVQRNSPNTPPKPCLGSVRKKEVVESKKKSPQLQKTTRLQPVQPVNKPGKSKKEDKEKKKESTNLTKSRLDPESITLGRRATTKITPENEGQRGGTRDGGPVAMWEAQHLTAWSQPKPDKKRPTNHKNL